MYTTYIFDFDYTLANSEQGIVMCFEKLFADEGYGPFPRKDICRTIGMTMYDAIASLTGETSPQRINELAHLYKIRYADKYMTAHTHLYPQTVPTLRRLKAKGARCCIVSSKTRSRIYETICRDGLGGLIDYVIGREDVAEAKPAPEGILKIRDRFAVQSEAILYIGDSLIDAQTAANAGVSFAAVTTGATAAHEFAAYPHVQIMKHLDELHSL